MLDVWVSSYAETSYFARFIPGNKFLEARIVLKFQGDEGL